MVHPKIMPSDQGNDEECSKPALIFQEIGRELRFARWLQMYPLTWSSPTQSWTYSWVSRQSIMATLITVVYACLGIMRVTRKSTFLALVTLKTNIYKKVSVVITIVNSPIDQVDAVVRCFPDFILLFALIISARINCPKVKNWHFISAKDLIYFLRWLLCATHLPKLIRKWGPNWCLANVDARDKSWLTISIV